MKEIFLVIMILGIAAGIGVPVAYNQINEQVNKSFNSNSTITKQEIETGNYTFSSDPEINQFIKNNITK